jgi:hypothetical protein
MSERYRYADAEQTAIYADFGDGRTATAPRGSSLFDWLVYGDEETPPKSIEPFVPGLEFGQGGA